MANPIQRAAVRRKVGYFVALIALFTLTMYWRGKLTLTRDLAATRWLSDHSVLEQAEKLDLRELDQGDAEITGSVARLSLIGARGPVITGLWWSAIEKQKRNEWHEFELLVKAVTRLQPNFITPWIFQSWNIAYNVSVENDKLGDMFFYIARGIELLAEGDRLNSKIARQPDGTKVQIGSPDLRYQIGFYYQNKFGVSDKVQTLRSLMQVAAIPPGDRVPALLNPDQSVNADKFREFCVAHPQLVRRLKTKLACNSPEDVVQFLRDNDKIPSLYKPGTNQLAEPASQFPVLPERFPEGPEEAYPAASATQYDDRFDAFHAARAWYTYANTVVPPAKPDENGDPLPWATPTPGEYDAFRHRVPRQPTLIIFKIAPCRAQSYLAERLAKEGWFDEQSVWSPAEDGAAGAWGGTAGGDATLTAAGNSRVEYERAWQLWDQAGRGQGLVLEPDRLARLTERGQKVPFGGGLPPDLSPEEMKAANIDPLDMQARRALTYYEQNRQMTNFEYFLDSSLAEKDPLTVRARRLLYEADQARQSAGSVRATRLYVEGLAKWREVLAKYPRFHRSRGDLVEDQTYELELELYKLLKEDGAVRARAARAVDALRALVPAGADLETTLPDLQVAFAEDEANSRIVAEQMASVFPGLAPDSPHQMALQRVAQVTTAAAAAVGPLALTAAGGQPVTRALIDDEFAWMKVASRPGGNILFPTAPSVDDYWVRPYVRETVRGRMGLTRMSTATPQDAPPSPDAPPLPR